uniref:Uncharacterized protein n=1 Tax=Anguilla anguilla TaxID=7936 RepID=A0A0E9WIK1_ANGAN
MLYVHIRRLNLHELYNFIYILMMQNVYYTQTILYSLIITIYMHSECALY